MLHEIGEKFEDERDYTTYEVTADSARLARGDQDDLIASSMAPWYAESARAVTDQECVEGVSRNLADMTEDKKMGATRMLTGF